MLLQAGPKTQTDPSAASRTQEEHQAWDRVREDGALRRGEHGVSMEQARGEGS